MSSVTDISAPIRSDRCRPQADLLIALRNDNYAEFEDVLENCRNGVNVNYLYEGPDYKTLLEIACSCKGKWKFVGRLLESGAIVNSLNKMHGKAPIHLVVLYSDYETLKLLVENPGIDINFPDREGNTVLHYAVQLDNRKMIRLLLDNGAHIGVRNSNGDPAVKFMSASTLEYLLDRSLSTRGQLLEKDYQIIFDYSLLVCKQDTADLPVVEETELLTVISKVPELEPLLKHPVLTSFLDLKWQNVTSGLYWRMLLIYTLFLITITAFIMLTYVPKTIWMENKNGTSNKTKSSANDSNICNSVNETNQQSPYTVWQGMALVCISFILFREVLQLLFYSKCRYYSEWENYLKAVWIGVTYTTLINTNLSADYRKIFAALTTFLSYIELMLLISQHPVVSISVDQFKKMICSYMKLMTWYAAFILAFVISFYIQFWRGKSCENYTFPNVTAILMKLAFKTPNMWNDDLSFHYVWLGIYFFFVTVTLFGLLNNVSVTAMAINEERVKFVSQAKFIIGMETAAPDLISLLYALTDCYPSLIERRLKRRPASARDSKHYSASFCPPSAVERKVYVFINQKNRIVTKNMKFKNEDVDESSCCCFAKTWAFSKSSIESAKKILLKKSSQLKCIGAGGHEGIGNGGHEGIDKVVQAVAKLQNRLAAVEKSEGEVKMFVETTIKQTSLEDQVRFESLMKATEERLRNAVKDASKGAVAEIRTFLEEIVPMQARKDADYFYST